MTEPKPFWEADAESWQMVINTNVNGTYLMTRAVIPHMLQQQSGRIINISINTVFTNNISLKGINVESELPITSFKNRKELRLWLEKNSTTSQGLRVRLYKVQSKITSIGFHDLLEEGLCFGWSESKRHPYDKVSYLQFFTPRKTRGTASTRNKLLVEKLIREGRMTKQGLRALKLE